MKSAGEPPPDGFALSYLPLVGMLVGAVSGVAAWAAAFVLPHAIVVAIAFALPIVLTGAIHMDGFLDSCDALFATVSVQRRLEIFKDPRHGTFAVVGMAVLTVFWISALWNVHGAQFIALLALTGGVTRLGALLNAFWTPYARVGQLTRQFESRPSLFIMLLSAALLLALSLYVWTWAWAVCLAAIVYQMLTARLCAARLGGGLVGDVYGFLIVTGEVLILSGFAARA